jgi:hypothetical protein
MDYNAAGQPIIRVSTGSSGYGNTVINGNTGTDAFGRTRISEPFTLFDSQNRYLDGNQFASKTAGTGSVTYQANSSSFALAVGTASGDSVIRQCRTVQVYQPGKSLLVMDTFAMGTLQTGLRQRVGYFTSGNGVYFEADGEDLYMVIRSSVTGSVVETRIAQSNWNQDSMDGTGPSGITLDPTKTQIFWTDIEWLGVGSVRVGFVINGIFYICHVFNHANIDSTVYMTTATLNCRYEITNTANTASPATMQQICSTVISEGGYNPITTIQYVSNGTNPYRVATGNVKFNLASIRLGNAYPDAAVIASQIDLLLIDVRYGQFQLVLNASNAIANTQWANVTNSVVQSNEARFEISDGTVVYAGLSSSRDEVEISEDIRRRLQLGRDVDGVSDTLTLCVSYTQNNGDILYKFGWEEISN